jgi:hypothetical protein
VSAVVPTSGRVEAGWDRTQPAAAAVNRLRITDHVLDASAANIAAALTDSLAGVSVADAHIGAVVRSLAHDEVVVLTSDPGDITRAPVDRPARTVDV